MELTWLKLTESRGAGRRVGFIDVPGGKPVISLSE